MTIVDAHHHVWDLSVRDQDWITGPELAPLRRDFGVGDLLPEARAAGVGRTVVVQTVTVPGETPSCSRSPNGTSWSPGSSAGPTSPGRTSPRNWPGCGSCPAAGI